MYSQTFLSLRLKFYISFLWFQFFKDQMSSVLPFTDIVFGNETEAAAYAESFELNTTDIGEIAMKIAQLPKVDIIHLKSSVGSNIAHWANWISPKNSNISDCASNSQENGSRSRLVVITQGSDPVIWAQCFLTQILDRNNKQ